MTIALTLGSRTRIAFAGTLIVLGLAWPKWSAGDEEDFNVRQPYSAERCNPITYDAEMVFSLTAPAKTKLLRVWLPIPPSDAAQELIGSDWTTFPLSVDPRIESESVFGNRFAYFEFPNPQGGQQIRHRFQIRVWELNWKMDPAKIQTVSHWTDAFKPYLQSERQSVVTDERFERLLKEIVPQRQNPLLDLQSVMRWQELNFKYDHQAASLQASSVFALLNRSGHCSDYHGFCAAMGRLMRVPTAVTYGIHTMPKSSPSHCKLEAFLPPYGWVSFDISESQKLIQAIQADAHYSPEEQERLIQAANARLCGGFRDNTWFLQTRGTDYDLVPNASKPVPVVRTLYAEADGIPLLDPDPSNPKESKFAWMVSSRFDADREVVYPFATIKTLEPQTIASPNAPDFLVPNGK